MEGADALLAISEVSVAFAGFTSIVGVLGHRDGQTWSRENSLRLWLMIEASIATLFFWAWPRCISLLCWLPFMHPGGVPATSEKAKERGVQDALR